MGTEERWHAIDIGDIGKVLDTDIDRGLEWVETRKRLEEHGRNVLTEEEKVSPLKVFIKQFANTLIIILLIATTFSAIMGEIIDAVVIIVIIVFVTLLGFYQEYRAERTLDALKKMLHPMCIVKREGSESELAVSELVPGDVVILSTGNIVPADMRLVEATDLRTDEAALTGESVPLTKTVAVLPKDVQMADRTNMVFAGTTIVYGKGRAVVVATGMKTQFGKIAEALKTIVHEKTPLERRMSEIGKKIGLLALAIILIVVVAELGEEFLVSGHFDPTLFIRVLLFGIALAVAAVPEALPAVVTANLAIGMRILARQNALIRKMHAVETLGCTQIICSDKTGTLTKGEMTVRKVYFEGRQFEVSGAGYEATGGLSLYEKPIEETDRKSMLRLALACVLCNDARIDVVDGRRRVIGDPTEGSLLVFAEKLGLDPMATRVAYARKAELPFSSERKLMTVINSGPDGSLFASMKGAMETVIESCTHILDSGAPVILSEEKAERIIEMNDEMASNGLRVIAIAERILPTETSFSDKSSVEKDFVFLGLVGMMDPPRPEAQEAIRIASGVGMKTVMITGDHKLTAMAIAKEIGILSPGDLALTGEELERLSDEEFEVIVDKVTVYARVSPSHKLRIVTAWQKQGRVVAMTGDGVNDAPALKSADIGIAMGITGTDIAKEAAHMVLTDDNFATIVNAVERGRWIYDNIKKYLTFLLQANLVEIAVLSIGMLFVMRLMGFEGEDILPLLPVHILYINLATDGLPALALSFSPPDPDIMSRPPRKKDESVFTRDVKLFLVVAILVQTPILLIAFISGLQEGVDAARTRLFLMLVFIEFAVAINCRSLEFTVNKAKPHKWLLLAIAWEVLLLALILAISPARDALHLGIPTVTDIVWITSGGLIAFIVMDSMKRFVLPRMGRKNAERNFVSPP